MASKHHTDDGVPGYDHEPVRAADLDGLTETKAANIAGELQLTTVDSIKKMDRDGEYRVRLEVAGGFLAFVNGTTKYGITHVGGSGNPDTVTITVVEKRV